MSVFITLYAVKGLSALHGDVTTLRLNIFYCSHSVSLRRVPAFRAARNRAFTSVITYKQRLSDQPNTSVEYDEIFSEFCVTSADMSALQSPSNLRIQWNPCFQLSMPIILWAVRASKLFTVFSQT